MSNEPLGPTPEWMRKHAQQFEPPKIDRDTVRRAYRKLTAFEDLHRRGDIEYYQLRTAEALERHLYGSQGADVRLSDESQGPSDMNGGLARAYHAAKVANAEAATLPKEWSAVMSLMHGTMNLDQIGGTVTANTKREIRRARGLALIVTALDRIATLWGLMDTPETKRATR